MSAATTTTCWRTEDGLGGVRTLWFDSPGRLQNVLDLAALDELERCIAAAEGDPSIKGLLLRSGKAEGFCAGMDIEMVRAAASGGDLRTYLRRGLDVLERLARVPQPTRAIVHGTCLGGGLELALACRSRIALASNVPLQLGTPEVQFGLVPAWGAIVRLCRLLAPRDALNLLLTGNPIGFLQAKSQGLVDRLLSQEESHWMVEALGREPSPRSVDPHTWASEIQFATARAAGGLADFPEAQNAILRIIEIHLASGAEAACTAAIEYCAELAASPETQAAISEVLLRSPTHG